MLAHTEPAHWFITSASTSPVQLAKHGHQCAALAHRGWPSLGARTYPNWLTPDPGPGPQWTPSWPLQVLEEAREADVYRDEVHECVQGWYDGLHGTPSPEIGAPLMPPGQSQGMIMLSP